MGDELVDIRGGGWGVREEVGGRVVRGEGVGWGANELGCGVRGGVAGCGDMQCGELGGRRRGIGARRWGGG